MAQNQRSNERGRQGQHMENLAQKSAQTPGSASNLATYLRGIDMPASRRDLLRHAQQNGAPQEVQRFIENMPDRQYNSMADVMKEFGQEK